jgi:hypothetical protein
MGQPSTLVALPLFAAVLLHGFRVFRSIVLPVVGMLGTPLSRTVQAHLPVIGVRANALAMIVRLTPLLASAPAAHCLLRPVGR